MNNNDFSKLRSSIDKNYAETPNLDNHLHIKRKEPSSFSNSIKLNRNSNSNNNYNKENGISNHFTLTAFNSFKSNKNTLIKSDQMQMPSNYVNNNINITTNKKENVNNLANNYWASDFRSSASPTKLHRLSVPSSKTKQFSNTNSSKFLNNK